MVAVCPARDRREVRQKCADLTQQLIRNDGFAVIFFAAIVRKMLKGLYQVH